MKDKRYFIRNHRKRLRIAGILSLVLVLGAIIIAIALKVRSGQQVDVQEASAKLSEMAQGRITDILLTPNTYSRSQKPIKAVKGVVVHYTANPGTEAKANRDYFNRLPEINKEKGSDIYASSHYVIGLEGEIIRCIPETEIAYASNNRNSDTLSIECCHPKKNGKFRKATYESLVWLTASICKAYGLQSEDVIRHYDITGKICPKYFVEHEDAWEKFKTEVQKEIDRG